MLACHYLTLFDIVTVTRWCPVARLMIFCNPIVFCNPDACIFAAITRGLKLCSFFMNAPEKHVSGIADMAMQCEAGLQCGSLARPAKQLAALLLEKKYRTE